MVISELQFKCLQKINCSDFDSVLEIYQTSFPAHERLPIDVFKTRIQSGLDELIVGYLHGEVVLMATMCLLSNTSGLVLVYLATSPQFKGQGVGTLFFHNLSQRLQQQN